MRNLPLTKICLLGDTHFGARGDNDILAAYMLRYYDEYFFPLLNELRIKTVVQPGDLLDRRKYTNHETLFYMRTKFLEILEKHNIKCYVLIGNHDIYYRNSNKISGIEEFIRGYDNIIPILDNTTIDIDGTSIDLIPWLNDENIDLSTKFIEESNSKYCIGHFEFSGFKFAKDGFVNDKGLGTKMFRKYDHVYSGHYHTRSSKGNVTYIGTPYELTWSDYDDPKSVTILDTETGDTELVINPLTLHNKIEYNDSVDYKQSDLEHIKGMIVRVIINSTVNKKKYEKFTKLMYDMKPAHVEIIDNSQVIKYDNSETVVVNRNTEELLNDGVENIASVNDMIDQDKLRKLSNDIYQRALSLGTY